ncbi:hypothetical protein Dip518_000367 [Parelusimicrobium proximum]|uniref:hypothetical protein n=1 Tax=Parelusimicrobium proximum TaxID=3228953 RepID=UPI003D186296
MKRIFSLIILCLFAISSNAETISFATYYPVPYAEYPQVTVVENSSLVEKGGTFTSKDFNVGVRTDAQKNLTATTLDGTKTGTNAIATIADPAKTKIRGDLEVTTFDVTQTALTGNGSNKGVAKAYLQNLYIYGKLFPDPAKVSGATAMEWSNIKFYVDGGTYQRDFLKLITGPGGTCTAGSWTSATSSTKDTCDGDTHNAYAGRDKDCVDVMYDSTSTGSSERKGLTHVNATSVGMEGETAYMNACTALISQMAGQDDLNVNVKFAYKKLYYMLNGQSYDDPSVGPGYGVIWNKIKNNDAIGACNSALDYGFITQFDSCIILQHKETYGVNKTYYADIAACVAPTPKEAGYVKRTITCDSGPTPSCSKEGQVYNSSTKQCECSSATPYFDSYYDKCIDLTDPFQIALRLDNPGGKLQVTLNLKVVETRNNTVVYSKNIGVNHGTNTSITLPRTKGADYIITGTDIVSTGTAEGIKRQYMQTLTVLGDPFVSAYSKDNYGFSVTMTGYPMHYDPQAPNIILSTYNND